LIGTGSVKMHSVIGDLILYNIPASASLTITGMSGLKTFDMKINTIDVVDGSPDTVTMNTLVTFQSPSNVDTYFGSSPVDMNIYYNGTLVANASVGNFSILSGDNSNYYSTLFIRNPLTDYLFTLYANDHPIPVSITVVPAAFPYLINPFSHFILPTAMPGLGQQIILNSTMHFYFSTIWSGKIATTLVMINPFSTPLSLLASNVVIDFHSETIGSAELTFTDPIYLQAHEIVTTPQEPISFKTSIYMIESFFKSFTGVLYDISGDFTLEVNQFKTTIHYEENSVYTDLMWH